MSLLSLITGSHDLQQLVITNTSNDICLQFIFVIGTTINEVHLHLENDKESYLLGNGNFNNQHTFNKCFIDVPPGNWILYACDGVLPNVNDTCSNPPVILTDITVTGNVSNSSLINSSVISTTSIGKSKVTSIKYNVR